MTKQEELKKLLAELAAQHTDDMATPKHVICFLNKAMQLPMSKNSDNVHAD